MRFSIKDLVRDVEEYKVVRDHYNDVLKKSKEKKNKLYFWKDSVSEEDVKLAFVDYVKCMQGLEKKYNRNYYDILRKQALQEPSAPPYDDIIM